MSRDRTARTRIRQYLATSGAVVDPSGYATSVLKDAIGYTGSPVAFIQLIAAMDRDGEIEREIRGKRTYRIEGIGAPPMPSVAAAAPAARPSTSVAVPGQPTIELDYRKLAQALVRELLTATAAANHVAGTAGVPADADKLSVEREQYAARLQLARTKLDELLAEPLASAPADDDAIAGR